MWAAVFVFPWCYLNSPLDFFSLSARSIFAIACHKFRKPARTPNIKKITVNHGDVSNTFLSRYTPTPNPMNTENATDGPTLPKYAFSFIFRIFSLFIEGSKWERHVFGVKNASPLRECSLTHDFYQVNENWAGYPIYYHDFLNPVPSITHIQLYFQHFFRPPWPFLEWQAGGSAQSIPAIRK